MSVNHRSIARLPLDVFENLATCSFQDEPPPPQELRALVVKQLKSVPQRKSFRTVYVNISTVGPLLRLSPPTLLRALDPLLTYGELSRRLSCTSLLETPSLNVRVSDASVPGARTVVSCLLYPFCLPFASPGPANFGKRPFAVSDRQL